MDYSSLTKAELESALKRLQSNLEDLEETINFNFTYSASHIDGGQSEKTRKAS